MKKKIFILAGEPSGDIHGARLLKELRSQCPEIEIVGIGGPMMESEGLKSLVPISDMAVSGIWEVLKHYGFFRKTMDMCISELREGAVDLFLPIDYPGFNIRLATEAKKMGIPVAYYIAPQLWAWGKNRADKISKVVDKLLVVFPFEVDFFHSHGINAEYVGHPLMDSPEFSDVSTNREPVVAFFPGSRRQELSRHLPIVERVSDLLAAELPDHRIALAMAKSLPEHFYDELRQRQPEWEFTSDSRQLMRTSACGLVKTGTTNLEAALLGLPFAMFYRTSFVSYVLSKKMINLPYISLVNILTESFTVKELIQSDSSPEKITTELVRLVRDSEYRDGIEKVFADIRQLLGSGGASRNAARKIIEML